MLDMKNNIEITEQEENPDQEELEIIKNSMKVQKRAHKLLLLNITPKMEKTKL